VTASYDAAGNRTSLTNPGSITTTATYDAANRLSQLTQGVLSWGVAYDGAGNRTSLTQPNGTTTTYFYKLNNWLESINHQGASLGAISISYGYDPNGNRLTQTDPSGTTTYSYDGLNRLIQAVYPGTYGSWTWSYDEVGNRIQQVSPGGVTTYVYDANNRMTAAGPAIYAYDANGNLIDQTGQHFGYNEFNLLTGVAGSGWNVLYTYNGAGLKVQRVGPDGTTRYYYDGIKPIWETDGVGAMTSQLDRDIFGNLLSWVDGTGARRYYHPDGIGSTIALTNEAGAVADQRLYDAWGNTRSSSTGTVPGKYQFTGSELDPTTGLYHMGARFYDPTVGRWLSEDPLEGNAFEPATLNAYTYALNNPVVLLDPSGREACDQACLERKNQERQDIVKKLLEIVKDSGEAVAQYLKEIIDKVTDPDTGAKLTAWLAAITGTLSVVAFFTGNEAVALTLGAASVTFTLANMVFTDMLYRRGSILPRDYYMSQAWNSVGVALGGAGLFAGAMRGLPSFRQGVLAAASVIARTLGGEELPFPMAPLDRGEASLP